MVNKPQGKLGLNDDYRLSKELMMKVDGYRMLISSMLLCDLKGFSEDIHVPIQSIHLPAWFK